MSILYDQKLNKYIDTDLIDEEEVAQMYGEIKGHDRGTKKRIPQKKTQRMEGQKQGQMQGDCS